MKERRIYNKILAHSLNIKQNTSDWISHFRNLITFKSFRAKRGNLFTSIHSLYFAQSSRRKAHGVFFSQLSTINHKLSTSSFAHGSRRKAQGFFFPQLSTLNHKLSTLIPARQCTNIVILKSAVVTSILKNLSILSLRAKRGNLFTSIHSLNLAQGSRHKAHGVFFPQLSTINYKLLTLFAHGMLVLLFIFVMLLQSGCSLTADRYIERYLGNNSICWEDNDHILIYASIAQYWYNQDLIGGESKEYAWVVGEIDEYKYKCRIDKEILGE